MSRHGLSQRRACRLVGVDPKTVRREPDPDNPEIRVRMRELDRLIRLYGKPAAIVSDIGTELTRAYPFWTEPYLTFRM